MSLSYFRDELASVRTKKKEFLAQIEQIIPWGGMGNHYPAVLFNKPYALDLMLHLHILQNLFSCAGKETES